MTEPRVALVTGGARGIGAAVARRLHAQGRRVVLADLLTTEAEELADELDGRAYRCDVTDSDGVRDMVSAIETDLAPVCVGADRAVTIGLILTELIINAQKYAYDGAPGPLRIGLTEADDSLRLVVSDDGKGGHKAGKGFGSMMIGSLVAQLGGQIDYRDQKPGLEVALRTRIEAPA